MTTRDRLHRAALLLAGALLATAALAQPPAPMAPGPPHTPPPPGSSGDPLAQQLFPPELVLANADDIALTAAQRETIKAAVGQAQPAFLDLQFQLQPEVGKLVKIVAASPVDEKAALAQAEKVMALETQMKKTQLAFLIRIKNALTPEQQAKLRARRPG